MTNDSRASASVTVAALKAKRAFIERAESSFGECRFTEWVHGDGSDLIDEAATRYADICARRFDSVDHESVAEAVYEFAIKSFIAGDLCG